jgi:hypothetical protein
VILLAYCYHSVRYCSGQICGVRGYRYVPSLYGSASGPIGSGNLLSLSAGLGALCPSFAPNEQCAPCTSVYHSEFTGCWAFSPKPMRRVSRAFGYPATQGASALGTSFRDRLEPGSEWRSARHRGDVAHCQLSNSIRAGLLTLKWIRRSRRPGQDAQFTSFARQQSRGGTRNAALAHINTHMQWRDNPDPLGQAPR